VPPPETAAARAWMDEVRTRLSVSEREGPEALPTHRRAGVLVPLYVRDGNLWVLLTKRTESVEKHRGQIAFPGGGREESDESLYRTALRETEEEVGVRPEDVRYLGDLTPIVTVTDYYVEPYVGAIPYPYPFQLQESEIAGLIEAPLPALLDPKALEARPFPGRDEPVLFFHYGETVIWGATARILKELLDALRG
jgi:8-oxo-dGTP pyrophosphatase MutT (NUDIX family)